MININKDMEEKKKNSYIEKNVSPILEGKDRIKMKNE